MGIVLDCSAHDIAIWGSWFAFDFAQACYCSRGFNFWGFYDCWTSSRSISHHNFRQRNEIAPSADHLPVPKRLKVRNSCQIFKIDMRIVIWRVCSWTRPLLFSPSLLLYSLFLSSLASSQSYFPSSESKPRTSLTFAFPLVSPSKPSQRQNRTAAFRSWCSQRCSESKSQITRLCFSYQQENSFCKREEREGTCVSYFHSIPFAFSLPHHLPPLPLIVFPLDFFPLLPLYSSLYHFTSRPLLPFSFS